MVKCINNGIAEVKNCLNDNGIILELSYNTASLIFKDGTVLNFQAEGYEGTKLIILAEIKTAINVDVSME